MDQIVDKWRFAQSGLMAKLGRPWEQLVDHIFPSFEHEPDINCKHQTRWLS